LAKYDFTPLKCNAKKVISRLHFGPNLSVEKIIKIDAAISSGAADGVTVLAVSSLGLLGWKQFKCNPKGDR
jgi:hypothetical protein